MSGEASKMFEHCDGNASIVCSFCRAESDSSKGQIVPSCDNQQRAFLGIPNSSSRIAALSGVLPPSPFFALCARLGMT